jgi:hypothetical protein
MSLLPMNFLSNGVKGSGNMRRILGNFVYFVRKFKKQVSNLRMMEGHNTNPAAWAL